MGAEPENIATGRVVGAVLLGLAVALAAVAYGYASNQALAYHGGLLMTLLALVVGAFLGMRGRRAVGIARLSLAGASLIVALEAVELAWVLQQRLSTPKSGVLYTYDEARANRVAFLRWWDAHLRRWARIDENLVMPDPTGRSPYVLVPGATIVRHESEIHVNRRGFRGPEISPDEEDRFRIVALGESTTFGFTMEASDRTWSAALEQEIARTLRCERPVEVINAGVPGWTIANQVARLEADVLPLRPGLIVTYFGQNGFTPFLRDVPGLALQGYVPPRPRPSVLLGGLERAFRLRPIRLAQPDPSSAESFVRYANLERTAYWRFYRDLVRLSRKGGARVALSSFNLAVNEQTPEEVIRFYEERTVDVRSRIVANRMHTRIVQRVAARHGATFVDTSEQLDGAYDDAYVDLVHFTQLGRERLARHVLVGIRPLLRSHPRLHCTDRG